ncbi:odorant receptor 13a-like, partial [Vespula squamosa]
IENTQIHNHIKTFIAYALLFKYFSLDFTSLVFQKLEEVEVCIVDELNELSTLASLAINYCYDNYKKINKTEKMRQIEKYQRCPLIGPEGGSIGSLGDFEDQAYELLDDTKKKKPKASKSLENKSFRSQIDIKNSDIGCRFIGQWNTILSEMHFKFAILRTKIILSPRFCITLFDRKIVIFYCLFRGYQHSESDNVAQTAARLFWNLAIGSSRLVVPTVILGFLDLMDFIADFHYVLRNIMENMLVFMTLTKFGVRRIKCQPLSKFLTEAEDDYIIDNYKTKEVRLIFMKYNNIASKFINKAVTEAVRCEELCLWLHTPIFRHNICPFRLRRNLLACTGFHLTGQLAIIKCRVKEFLKNNHDSHGRVRQMILRHYRLISIRKMSLQKITYPPRICFRLADTSEDSFNIVTCLHMSLARSEKVYIFTFLIYFCLLLCTLYSYCYVGQCLIEEVLIEFLLNCNSIARTSAMRFIVAIGTSCRRSI